MDKKVLLTELEKFDLIEKVNNSKRVKKDQRKEKKIRELEKFEKRGYEPKKHGKAKRHPCRPTRV